MTHDPANSIAHSLTEILTALHGCMKFYGDDSAAAWHGVDGRFTITVPTGQLAAMLKSVATETGINVVTLPDPAQMQMNTQTANAITRGKVR